jgi:uncharacterized repeat protein (TIGR01451 family)
MLSIAMLLSITKLNAQWFQIVDPQFQTFLEANFPQAVQGDSINSAHQSVISTTILTLDNLQIQFINGIEAFQNLTKLSAKNNQFNYTYPLQNLIHLEELYLNYNYLAIQVDFTNLTQLRHLEMTNSGMLEFPILGNPNVLEVLNLNSNYIDSMPSLINYTSLKKLELYGNYISNLPTLPSGLNLTHLQIGGNDIPVGQLNVLSNYSLYFLGIGNMNLNQYPPSINSISSLKVLVLSQNNIGNIANYPQNLDTLYMSDINCTDLGVLPNSLYYLSCANNNISTINQLPTNLMSLYTSNCTTLTSISATLPNNLKVLYVNDCSLNTFSQIPNALQKLNIIGNNFTCLPSLPNTLTHLYAQNNNILCLPNLPVGNFYCDIPKWVCQIGNPNNCNTNNLIFGNVYLDNNGNEQIDSNEIMLPNVNVIAGNNYYTQCNDTGFYQATPAIGTHILKTANLNYQTNNNDTSISLTANVANLNINLPVQLLPNIHDLSIFVGTCFPPRPFETSNIIFHYKNRGTVFEDSVTIKFVPDSFLNLLSSSINYSLNGDTIVFKIYDLGINEQGTISTFFQVSLSAPMGDTLHSEASINNSFTDNNINNNISYLNEVVVNSFDPNDKNVFPNGGIPQDFIDNSDSLVYTIRFQNTGTASAFNIAITDSLSSLLDIASFKLIGYSFPPTISINNNLLTFYFNHIYLPDSNSNEPLSHGFVTFSIKPKATMINTDTLKNRAFIYFDYNEPVITNYATTYIVRPESIKEKDDLKGNVKVYPNPFREQTIFEFNLVKGNTILSIYDAYGRLIHRQNIIANSYIFKKEGLSSGIYYFSLTNDADEQFSGKLMIK